MGQNQFLGIVFTVLLAASAIYCQDEKAPPRVIESYRAYGEMVENVTDPEAGNSYMFSDQIAFVENYDNSSANAVFTAWIMGKNATMIENGATKQAFEITEGVLCEEMKMNQWLKSNTPPGLQIYENNNGSIRFSLKQLFGINDIATPVKGPEKTIFRDIPAKMWIYEFPGEQKEKVFIHAYWSDGTYNMSSSRKTVPLGFRVEKFYKIENKMHTHEIDINIFGFAFNTYDRKAFEPVHGVICPNRISQYKFPSVNKMKVKAVSFRSEFVLPDSQEFSTIDTWYDTENKMLRIDMETVKGQTPLYIKKDRRYSSEMISKNLGLMFKIDSYAKEKECIVTPIDQYESDVNNIIIPTLPAQNWTIESIFGLNFTNYVYTGKRIKRNIPCHVFQGIRKDWPDPKLKQTSLWEWCFALNLSPDDQTITFRDNEIPLLDVHIKILETGSDAPPGERIFHHFYNVLAEDPEIMDAMNFDIRGCFTEGEREELQFSTDWDVKKDKELAINATSDITFLQKWKKVLYSSADLKPESMRISRVRSTVNGNKLYIKFTLLSLHKKQEADDEKRARELFEKESNIRLQIDRNEVKIEHQFSKTSKAKTVTASKDSLKYQINQEFKPHVVPEKEKTTTETTLTPFSLRPDPTDISKQPTKPSSKTSTDRSSSVTRPDGSSPVGPDGSSSVTEPDGSSPGTGPDGSSPGTGPGNSSPVTGPNDFSVTPSDNPLDKRNNKMIGHSKGTVAAVTIMMLLMGITIGSAGTFYKYNGLPACLKRT